VGERECGVITRNMAGKDRWLKIPRRGIGKNRQNSIPQIPGKGREKGDKRRWDAKATLPEVPRKKKRVKKHDCSFRSKKKRPREKGDM